MNVSVHLASALRKYCNCADELHVTATTVRTVLEQLEHRYPMIYRSICDETGRLRPHVHMFVNSSLVNDPQGLDRELTSDDRLTIWPAVSGG